MRAQFFERRKRPHVDLAAVEDFTKVCVRGASIEQLRVR
jgi:hypothetical protein